MEIGENIQRLLSTAWFCLVLCGFSKGKRKYVLELKEDNIIQYIIYSIAFGPVISLSFKYSIIVINQNFNHKVPSRPQHTVYDEFLIEKEFSISENLYKSLCQIQGWVSLSKWIDLIQLLDGMGKYPEWGKFSIWFQSAHMVNPWISSTIRVSVNENIVWAFTTRNILIDK